MLVKIIPITSSRSRLELTLWEELKMLFFFSGDDDIFGM